MAKKITVDARQLLTREQAHRYLKEQFGFPEYYGGNLDALNDCLGEIGEAEIVFKNASLLKDGYAYAARVLKVISDNAKGSDAVTLTVED